MRRPTRMTVAAIGALLLSGAAARATTRELAELQPARLSFERSILNQLTFGTYNDPYDELQARPYNLLFANVGRHANISPWAGQEGGYTRYLNALIGNNGVANIDNDADAIHGSMIRRESPRWAWGLSAAFLSGSDGSDDSNGVATFVADDDLAGFELRGAAARQISEYRVLGLGLRVLAASTELGDGSFEPGLGGFFGVDRFEEASFELDAGLRSFIGTRSSWEVGLQLGSGDSERDEASDTIDAAGLITDRFVTTNYDIGDSRLGVFAAYNRLRRERIGETEYRIGLQRTERELSNSDLGFSDAGGTITPNLTLLAQQPIEITELSLAARTIFQAGETEMFSGAELGYRTTEGATSVDAAGIIVDEAIDDTRMQLGLTLGVRQALVGDTLRVVVSGRADLLDLDRSTVFDSGVDGDSSSLSTAQYAIGLEAVLSNVNLDIAWLSGEEAPVVPVELGLPTGSRRAVEVDRLVFSAAVSW